MGKTKTAFVGEELEDKNKKKHQKQEKNEKVHIAGLKGGERVKIVEPSSAEASEGQGQQSDEKTNSSERAKRAERVRSKKYQEAKNKIDHEKLYPVGTGVKLVKEASYSKFDGTMEMHLTVKKVGISAQVALPHTAGREKKVEIASEDTIEKLKKGVVDFDILLATPEMMPKLVPFARLLGPKGLMPNPKNGTLLADPKKLKSFSASTITIKTEKDAPIMHLVVGKVSQADKEIAENIEAIFKALGGTKQIERAFLKSTMSPSVKLAV